MKCFLTFCRYIGGMTRVMAQGVFDVVHPGHLHYLRESADLGDELVVLVARDVNAHNLPLMMPEDARRTVVNALEMVDETVLGSEDQMFARVKTIDPDIITLGYDQPFDADELREMLAFHNLDDVEIVRIDRYDGFPASSSELRSRIVELNTQGPERD